MEEVAGVTRRRSPRLHSQTKPSEDGAGVTCHRSPRHHLQIHASEDGAGVTRRVHRRRGASLVSLPDDDDMLREILLRLPQQPSSLPRASAVCRRWRGLVTDPRFHRQFRAHHRKPPLLGFFQPSHEGIVFTPILDPPDHIPPQRFDLGRYGGRLDCLLLDCRHGRVLIYDLARSEIVVCDPITGEQRCVAFPSELRKMGQDNLEGAVLCAAGDHGHVHGGCHLSSYKVVLVSTGRIDYQPHDYHPRACVYSSETGTWGNVISIEAPCEYLYGFRRATLIGNILYWLVRGHGIPWSDRILEFDLDRQNLSLTVGPSFTNGFLHGDRQIIQAKDGVVGFAILDHPRFHMWQRNVSCNGVATWVPWKTIEMHNILGHSLQIEREIGWLPGYDEVNDIIFVYARCNVYAVQLKLMHSKKLYESDGVGRFLPFTSFYTPGTTINGGSNGAEMLHDA